jgi:psiF repeat
MRLSLFGLIVAGAITAFSGAIPGYAADNSQQQRMKDCSAQAAGMTGTGRQNFMSSCLSGNHPRCTPGKSKPCGNSCIALDKVCHK